MTERLADIDARIRGVRQLGAVVNAMRGIAAARAQQARNQLAAVDAHAQALAIGIGRALDLVAPDEPGVANAPARTERLALLVFVAEQGFAGAFSERVLDAAGRGVADTNTRTGTDTGPSPAAAELFLVGTRGATVAAARGIAIAWQGAAPSHANGIPALAERIAQALYARIAKGDIDRLDVVFSEWRPGHGLRVERRRLFPVDMDLFPHPPRNSDKPLVNLAPAALVAALSEDYLHARLCHAALHAFAAENEARMEAMAAARSQIERQLDTMQSTQRMVRQAEITAEIIELAAGEQAGSGSAQT
ncbi:hypothetical protein BH10PSE18_BH10PSE18_44900 [soil metagenome]